MTPQEFVRKWSDATLRERQGSQSHFIDLCRLLDVPNPTDDDPTGERYCFERGAEKAGGGDGWADVWKRGCFGWEYKGKHANLEAALRQLTIYAAALESPPLLVVCDMERIRVHTNFTNTVSEVHEFTLDDLLDPARRDLLRRVWTEPQRFRPGVNRQDLTRKAVERFGELGRRLQDRKHEPRAVAHFLNQLVFCMFAEDAGLLPEALFTRTLKATQTRPAAARAQLADLFRKMAAPEEEQRFFGPDLVRWFNGGLFDGAEPLPLESHDLALIVKTAEEHDWSEIDPSIFGTLFEQALKATRERPALGAHYTDREKILKIVEPVITRPLAAEWESVHTRIRERAAEAEAASARRRGLREEAGRLMAENPAAAREGEKKRRAEDTRLARQETAAKEAAKADLESWLQRLAAFRVLDPACGSGNFLYVALHALHDLEARAIQDFERATGLPGPVPRVTTDCVRGIEIDRYAAELARVTLWIGDLQWMLKSGYRAFREPILSDLTQIENRDALLNPDGTEAEWPAADVIIGNPPFVGGKKLRENLGGDAVERLFAAYRGRVPADADLVAYWVEKAWRRMVGPTDIGPAGSNPAPAPKTVRAGLVTTNSIRGGASRRVLDPIADADALWEAWADEPWTQEGAAVRVSMFSFGEGFVERRLNAANVNRINADLTAAGVDLTKAVRLLENEGTAFNGIQKTGPFEVTGEQARVWLKAPVNINNRPNADVLRPYWNGIDVVRRPRDHWVIDFTGLSEAEAASYELVFQYALLTIEPVRRASPVRNTVAREILTSQWWLFWRARPELMQARQPLTRTIVTPEVSKHRVFVWAPGSVGIDKNLIAVARHDDACFGVLHSRHHELWALRLGTSLEDRPRYTPSTTFETFPFPEGLTPNVQSADYADDPRAQAIAEAARELNDKREAWLNPPDLVRIEPEVVPGYPDRVLPVSAEAAAILKKRTLTNLYNERPAWLDMAHRKLDQAVAAAYGWPADLTDDEILERLFALNQERAAAGR